MNGRNRGGGLGLLIDVRFGSATLIQISWIGFIVF